MHELDTYIGWRIHSVDTDISVFISLISYFAISLSDRTVLNTISLETQTHYMFKHFECKHRPSTCSESLEYVLKTISLRTQT